MRRQVHFLLRLGMVAKVIISAIGNAFKLFHAVRKLIFDVIAGFGIMREVLFRSRINIDIFTLQPLLFPPFDTGFLPIFMPFFVFARHNEIFQFRLLKLANAKNEVARRNFVAERLADLGDAERQLARGGVNDVAELGKNRLSGFRTQIAENRTVVNRTDGSFKHQIERTGLGQLGRAAVRTLAVFDMIGAKPSLAFLAVGHRVGKSVFMPGIMQNFAVGQNGGVQTLNIVTLIDHGAPPGAFEVVLQLDAQRTVVIHALQTAVNIGVLENKPAAFAQRYKLIHCFSNHFLNPCP